MRAGLVDWAADTNLLLLAHGCLPLYSLRERRLRLIRIRNVPKDLLTLLRTSHEHADALCTYLNNVGRS